MMNYKEGGGNCVEFEQMLSKFRLPEQINKSVSYKKRWLLGVQAVLGEQLYEVYLAEHLRG